MMCAHLLRHEKERSEGRLSALARRGLNGMQRSYERSLRWVLLHQRLTVAVTLLTLVTSIHLYLVIPKGFLPQQDTDLIVGMTDAAQDISFSAMLGRQRAVTDVVLRDPDVVGVESLVSVGSTGSSPNTGRLYIALKPRNARTAGADEIIGRLRTATPPAISRPEEAGSLSSFTATRRPDWASRRKRSTTRSMTPSANGRSRRSSLSSIIIASFSRPHRASAKPPPAYPRSTSSRRRASRCP